MQQDMTTPMGTTVYKGNPYTGYPMILIWIMLTPLFILTLFAIRDLHPVALFTGGVLAFMFWITAGSANYYEVNDTSLVVRKYFRRNKIIVYPFDEISEVRFIKVKLAIHMEVQTVFESKTYPSGTLSKDTILSLQGELERRGVNVTKKVRG